MNINDLPFFIDVILIACICYLRYSNNKQSKPEITIFIPKHSFYRIDSIKADEVLIVNVEDATLPIGTIYDFYNHNSVGQCILSINEGKDKMEMGYCGFVSVTKITENKWVATGNCRPYKPLCN